jgi:hypothetical protein
LSSFKDDEDELEISLGKKNQSSLQDLNPNDGEALIFNQDSIDQPSAILKNQTSGGKKSQKGISPPDEPNFSLGTSSEVPLRNYNDKKSLTQINE